MVETIIFSLGAFIVLWPYFMWQGVLNFSKDENETEDRLKGRPARRTIGRKNNDVIKSFFWIMVFHIILSAVFYGLDAFRDTLGTIGFLCIVSAGAGYACYMIAPITQKLHGYMEVMHIVVVYVVCAVSVLTCFSAVLYGNTLSYDAMGWLSAWLCGLMFLAHKKNQSGEGE